MRGSYYVKKDSPILVNPKMGPWIYPPIMP